MLEYTSLILWAITVIFGAGILYKSIKSHGERIAALETKLSTRLYDEKGITVFMPRAECIRSQQSCLTHFNSIEKSIADLKTCLNSVKFTMAKMTGAFEQFVKDMERREKNERDKTGNKE